MDYARRYRIDQYLTGSTSLPLYLPAMADDQNAASMFRLMCDRGGVFGRWLRQRPRQRLALVHETDSGPDHRVAMAVPGSGASDSFAFEGMQARMLPTFWFHGPFGGLVRWWPYAAAVLVAAVAMLADGPWRVGLWGMCAVLFAVGARMQARGRLPFRPGPQSPRWSVSDEWHAHLAAVAIRASGGFGELMDEVAAQLAGGRRFADLDVPPEIRWALRRGLGVMERVQYRCEAAEADIRTVDARVVAQSEGLIWWFLVSEPDPGQETEWAALLEAHAQACRAEGWCRTVGCRRVRAEGERCATCAALLRLLGVGDRDAPHDRERSCVPCPGWGRKPGPAEGCRCSAPASYRWGATMVIESSVLFIPGFIDRPRDSGARLRVRPARW